MVFLGLVLVGCQQSDPLESLDDSQVAFLKESVYVPAQRFHGVQVTAEQDSYSVNDNLLVFNIQSHYQREKELWYWYTDLKLEVQLGNTWYTISNPNGWRKIRFVIPNDSSDRITIALQDWEYKFQPGHYRLVCEAGERNESSPSNWIAGEFDLSAPNPNQEQPIKSSSLSNQLRTSYGVIKEEHAVDTRELRRNQEVYSRTDPFLSFQLANVSEKGQTYHETKNIFLQVQLGGVWYFIPRNLTLEDTLAVVFLLEPNQSTEIKIFLENWDYEFQSGKYRIVFLEEEGGEWTAAEFDLL